MYSAKSNNLALIKINHNGKVIGIHKMDLENSLSSIRMQIIEIKKYNFLF